jgi:hypothetical protein
LPQAGILSIDTAPDAPALVATGGADATVVLFDRDAGRIRATLSGHSKKINSAQHAALLILLLGALASGSWRIPGPYRCCVACMYACMMGLRGGPRTISLLSSKHA